MDRDKIINGLDKRYTLFGLFFAFSNKLQAVCDRFYEEITCKQFFLLICLGLFGDTPASLNELAGVMGSTHQNIKQIVEKLEKSGFVTTCRHTLDGRRLCVSPTEKVEELGKKYGDREDAFFNRFYEGLSERDISLMLETLLMLEDNLDKFKEEMQ